MKRRHVALLTLISLVVFTTHVWAQGLPTAKPEQVGLSSERLERVTRALRAEIEAGKIPGAVALVARKGQVPKDAIFRLYSMTKPFASVAAMMLMEDGKLLITDPVAKFLPQLAKREVVVSQVNPVTGKIDYLQVPTEREMTVQDLFRHTSGLVYGTFTPNPRIKEVTRRPA